VTPKGRRMHPQCEGQMARNQAALSCFAGPETASGRAKELVKFFAAAAPVRPPDRSQGPALRTEAPSRDAPRPRISVKSRGGHGQPQIGGAESVSDFEPGRRERFDHRFSGDD